jgi:hypothetical protein
VYAPLSGTVKPLAALKLFGGVAAETVTSAP